MSNSSHERLLSELGKLENKNVVPPGIVERPIRIVSERPTQFQILVPDVFRSALFDHFYRAHTVVIGAVHIQTADFPRGNADRRR